MRNPTFTLLLLLMAVGPGSSGPWIADISEVTAGGRSLGVSLPAGERCTVGVYDVGRIEVECPPTVTAKVFLQHRYWLPSRRWTPPGRGLQGPYAVQLHTQAPGKHLVRIVCNGGSPVLTVCLNVTPSVPKPDMGFGFYFVPAYFVYPDHWHRYFECMRDLGSNTFTIYRGYPNQDAGEPGRAAADICEAKNIAWQLDLAVETGLTDGKVPIFVFAHSPDALDLSYTYGKHVDKWPELCGYGKDEPSAANEAEARGMVTMFNQNGKRPYRSGSAISAESIMRFGDGLDIWLCAMDGLSDIIKRRALEQHKELWVYCCELRGTNAPLNRYFTGWWAFKNRPRCIMSWVAFDSMLRWEKVPSCIQPDGRWTPIGYYEYLLQAPDGPVSSLGAEGRRDGIVDYMVLRELERTIERSKKYELADEAGHWLQDMVDRVDTNFWPNDQVPWGSGTNGEPLHWVLKDNALPPITHFNALRHKALMYIGDL